MKKLFFVLFNFSMLLLPFCTYVKSQTVCLNDMIIKDSIFTYNNLPYTGEFKCYNNRNLITSIGFLKNGLLDSVYFSYENDGKVRSKILYNNGHIIERMVCNDEGFYRTCITYKDNNLHGLWEKYFKDGKLKERRFYKYGEPVGVWSIWDKNGIPFVETTFTEDSSFRITHQYRKRKHIKLIEKSSKDRPYIIKRERIVEKLK